MEYQVLARVNTANQSIITNRLMVEIDGVISGTTYPISVMAVANGTCRSEVDSVSITAGGYSNNCNYMYKMRNFNQDCMHYYALHKFHYLADIHSTCTQI